MLKLQPPFPSVYLVTTWSSLLGRSYGSSLSLGSWPDLWHGTVARRTLPPSPAQSPLSVSSNPGSVSGQSGKRANLSCRSPWRWVVVKKRDTHLQLLFMSFISYLSVFLAADLAAFRPSPCDSVGVNPYSISLILYHSCWFCFCHGSWLLEPLTSMT